MKRRLTSAAGATALTALLALSTPTFAQDSSPAAPPVAEAATTPSPAPSRPKPAPDSVEAGLWDLADTAEKEARNSGDLNTDGALNAYVRGVMCKVADELCGDFRLYIMDRPFFNALMAPNGYGEVWSGLLLRLEDESQLAFVLGHEITHYADRDSIATVQALKDRLGTAMVIGIGLAVIGGAAAANSPNNAQAITNATQGVVNAAYLGTLFSFFGFSQEQEAKADDRGYDRATRAGYDPAAGGRIWRAMIAETAASDDPRTRNRGALGSLFATHPIEANRATALERRAGGQASADAGRQRYRDAIRPHLASWMRDELRRRDFGQTLAVINRLRVGEQDLGVLTYFEGEVYRQRRKDGDLERAATAYKAALTHDDAPPQTWRELGSIQLKSGDRAGALASFETYVRLAPTATDRALLDQDIAGLRTALSVAAPEKQGGTP